MGIFACYSQDHLTESSRPQIRVSDPAAPGQKERLNVTFFRRRVQNPVLIVSVYMSTQEVFWVFPTVCLTNCGILRLSISKFFSCYKLSFMSTQSCILSGSPVCTTFLLMLEPNTDRITVCVNTSSFQPYLSNKLWNIRNHCLQISQLL